MSIDPFVALIIIACIAAITVIIVVWINRGPKTHQLLAGVHGRIDHPSNGATVQRVMHCQGVVQKHTASVDIVCWLAVETDGLIWPKEAVVIPDDTGQWSSMIQEGGSPGSFAISLWVVTPQGAKWIQDWFDRGQRTNHFPGMSALPGARRVAQVNGLILAD